MPTLASELRNRLEKVVVEARDVAEVGARAALEAQAVHHHEPYGHMKPAQRELRNHLRARAKQLGDVKDERGRYASIDHLAEECAYEHWHRMLFARFLAENGLLIEPEMGVAMSLAEAEELAKEDVASGGDVWVFASRCAQRMLPQIFRPDDPLLQIAFATEHMVELERLLASLPATVFTASDALGWVYQHWQSKKKDEVNRSEVKIGADEISAVTQLFTEPYMVEFLLHNTVGAWWTGRQLSEAVAASAKSEDELRRKLALPGVGWEYLRFVRDADGEGEGRASGEASAKPGWRPAAGTFDGWPKSAAELKVLDPCCGSGHFLVAALHHLVPIRMVEEGLSAAEAVDAVLRDNLHGLEIDERCCQIAAFALAFAAWTYPDAGGYRELPDLHVACTGIGPQSTQEQWVKLAEESGVPMPTVGREAIKNGLLNLHRLFSQAPTLGSLINPDELPGDLIAADYETIQPYLTAIRAVEKADEETRERAIAASGMVKAADLLAGEYTLVITNVPYLGRGKQNELLMTHIEKHYADGKADLATAFVLRCLELCNNYGTTAAVTPQNWLFLGSYKRLRERLLGRGWFHFVAQLGEHGFTSNAAAGAFAALVSFSRAKRARGPLVGVDATEGASPVEKDCILRQGAFSVTSQESHMSNPDSRITVHQLDDLPLLRTVATATQGTTSGDNDQFVKQFWELCEVDHSEWVLFQSASLQTSTFAGRQLVLRWQNGKGPLASSSQARVQGMENRGKDGVVISQMRSLRATRFTGEHYAMNGSALVPKKPTDLPALWAYCSSEQFNKDVRKIDPKVFVTTASLVKAPFDLAHWQEVAAKTYPDGLPEPESDDPTQWLFHGHPCEAEEEAMLQVAVVRLLDYRWPAELDPDMRLSERARAMVAKCEELTRFADKDGIVCIPSVRGEEPAAERLLALLSACGLEPQLDLDDWLRNEFFQEHCGLFQNRSFVWHIWDGRKRDGFHALVNYHKLCECGGKGRKLLESLTYSYLGDWIARCKDEVEREEGGAEDRLAAAVALQDRLKAILTGEPPFDIFVRWKPLHEQPIGWEPDINDGVRMNIRPFLASDLPIGRKGAGILRWKPNIKWKKDRGKEPERPKAKYPWFWGWDEATEDFPGNKTFDANRWNDCHYTNKAKQAARDAEEEEGEGS